MVGKNEITNLIELDEFKFLNAYVDSNNQVHIRMEADFEEEVCPKCFCKSKKMVEIKYKEIRDLNLFNKICFIEFDYTRFECCNCHATFFPSLLSIPKHGRYTRRFEEEVYSLCQETTASHAGKRFMLSDKTAHAIYQRIALKKQNMEAFKMQAPTKLGIDEIAMHKGHGDYILIITDIGRKIVIDVLPDRTKETLEKWFDSKPSEWKQKIMSASTDLWAGYRSVVEEKISHAQVVADRFHVMQNLNKALDKCRKDYKRKIHIDDDDFWKYSKYALLKNSNSLTKNQEDALVRIFKECPVLQACYKLKEKFHFIFEESKNIEEGRQKLRLWVLDVVRDDLLEYYGFIKTVIGWEEQILNYFHDRITSGFVEGVNNKIKLIKRKAYGYQNFDNFRLKVIDCFIRDEE